MELREQKGREIADRARIVKEGNLYLVPSQSGKGKYKVRPDIPYCSCAEALPEIPVKHSVCPRMAESAQQLFGAYVVTPIPWKVARFSTHDVTNSISYGEQK